MVEMNQESISVAVSGGGHRATAWALGVMQGLVDCDLNPSVTSIVSVSGGSIANGAVAQSMDFQSVDRAEFDEKIEPLVDLISDQGLFVFGPSTNRYVFVTVATVSLFLGMLTSAASVVLAAMVSWSPLWHTGWGLLVLVGTIVFSRSRGFDGLARWLVLTSLFVGLGGLVGATLTQSFGPRSAAPLLVSVFAAIATFILFVVLWARRGRVLVKALDSMAFGGASLESIRRTVNHVFVAADLETADALYLSPHFVSSYRRGLTTPNGVSLAQAVQASAALPGAFPPSILTVTDRFKRPWTQDGPDESTRQLPLSDGGAYDNMGVQWDTRRRKRLECEWGSSCPEGMGPAPTLLVVANASAPWTWRRWTAKNPLSTEIASLSRNQGIQYDQTTATRRQVLFNTFSTAADTGKGLKGIILTISRTPFEVCDRYVKNEASPFHVRAVETRNLIARSAGCSADDCDHDSLRCSARVHWGGVVAFNSSVPTTLGKVGRPATDSIMSHARTAATAYLYVLHGLGDPTTIAAPSAIPDRETL